MVIVPTLPAFRIPPPGFARRVLVLIDYVSFPTHFLFPEVPLRGGQCATLWRSKWHFGKILLSRIPTFVAFIISIHIDAVGNGSCTGVDSAFSYLVCVPPICGKIEL